MKALFGQRKIKLPYGISVLVVSSFLLFLVPLFPIGIEATLVKLCLLTLVFLGALLLDDAKRYYLYSAFALMVLRFIGLGFDLKFFSMVVDILTVVFFAWVSVKIISQIIHKEASSVVIVESISGYILLAISLTTIMGVIVYFDPTAFSFPPAMIASSDETHFTINSYFILVTYTTVGYGDVLPISTAARSLAKLTALSGQIYIAVVVAILIGKYLQAKD